VCPELPRSGPEGLGGLKVLSGMQKLTFLHDVADQSREMRSWQRTTRAAGARFARQPPDLKWYYLRALIGHF